jgi:hypothetical protein
MQNSVGQVSSETCPTLFLHRHLLHRTARRAAAVTVYIDESLTDEQILT